MFLNAFASEITKFSSSSVFVDLFGGSGLLSRTCKDIHPSARVVYNDFDDYATRIGLIATTEQLRKRMLKIVSGVGKSKRIPDAIARKVIAELRAFEGAGNTIDYVTVSTWLLYTMHFCDSIEELEGLRLYNSVPSTPIDPASNYLDGLEVRHQDYRELLQEFGDSANVVYILDPPYLATNTAQYKMYWGIDEYLGVLELLQDKRYIYFGSGRSDLVTILDWAERRLGACNPFSRAIKHERRNTTNAGNAYTDVMYVVQ